ncbi:MAG TPA: MATE family efflux transporter [Candidatus Phocaeicola gallistercoris]|nr:MATE family efflux transporter [Candidatus Phocaeicola gallistercoris]
MNLKPYKTLLALGIPIVIGQIGVIVLGFVDTLMIGHHSTNELAAASFVNNMFNLAIIFCTGFSYGLTPIVGSLFGQQKCNAVGQILKNSLAANTLLAILVCSIMYILYSNLHRLGQPEELLPFIRPYFIVLLISLPFILWFNAFKQFTDGITDTKTSMWILLGGNVFNIIGNYILIYGKVGFPELGLLGAGISTLASRILMAAVYWVLFLYSKRYQTFRQGFTKGKINKQDFRLLNKLGWPIAGQMGMETASFSLSAIMVGWLGSAELATYQIMTAVSQVCFMVYYGMGAAVSVRISNFFGQRDMENIRRISHIGFHIILIMGVCTCIPIYLLRHDIGGWFTDNATVSAMVVQTIIPFLLYQFGDGLQINFANALRGISDVRFMMVYAFIAYFIISLPLSYFFGFICNWGIVGIWMAFPFGLTSAGIMYYLRFKYKLKQLSH